MPVRKLLQEIAKAAQPSDDDLALRMLEWLQH